MRNQLFFLLCLACTFLPGCATRTRSSAAFLEHTKLFQSGVTSRADVVAALGNPSSVKTKRVPYVTASWKGGDALNLPKNTFVKKIADEGTISFGPVPAEIAGQPMGTQMIDEMTKQMGKPIHTKFTVLPMKHLSWNYDQLTSTPGMTQRRKGVYTALFNGQNIFIGFSSQEENSTQMGKR